MLQETGKRAHAEAEYRKALAILQKLADDNPAVSRFRRDLANSHNNLGLMLVSTGKPAKAGTEYRRALALFRKLVDDNPMIPDYRLRYSLQSEPGVLFWSAKNRSGTAVSISKDSMSFLDARRTRARSHSASLRHRRSLTLSWSDVARSACGRNNDMARSSRCFASSASPRSSRVFASWSSAAPCRTRSAASLDQRSSVVRAAAGEGKGL